jgi:hypothetical protein
MTILMRKCLLCLTIIISVFGLGVYTVQASSFQLQSDTTSVYQNDTVTVTVSLDPEAESVNTIRVAVDFDSSLFSVKSVNANNSIVSSWIEPPTADTSAISFSGFMPNGFSGVQLQGSDDTAPGELFSFTLEPTNSGVGAVSVTGMEAFSGRGQNVSVARDSVSIEVRSAQYITSQQTATSTETNPQTNPTSTDDTPPQPFTPRIIQPSPGCGSPLFASFQTTDANSGIDQYEIAISQDKVGSTTDIEWQRVGSPYELTNAQANQWVTVKAVDKAGNERFGATQVTQDDITRIGCKQQVDTNQGSDDIDIRWFILLLIVIISLFLAFAVYRRSSKAN